MIYLDTHIVVWLYAGQLEKLSQQARNLMNENEIFISAIVRLELQYLYEIQRVTDPPHTIIGDLSNRIGLKICEKPFNRMVTHALDFTWTRDPFDRVIVANAALDEDILITRDRDILENYGHALC